MEHNIWERRLRARAPEYKQKQRTRTLRITNENVPNQVTDSETASVWTKRLRARAHEYKRQNIDSKKRARRLRSKKENFPNQVTDSETASIWTTRLRARAPGSEIKSLVLPKRKKTKILEQTKSALNVDQSKTKILEQTKSALNVDQSKQFDEHEKTLRDIFDKGPVVDRNKLSDQDDQEEFRAKYQQQDNVWGQSPELESALIRQRSIDPEYIFGQPLPLNIEELFGSTPFRSSSANWSSDALLLEEDLEYKELMGYIEF